jgi:hypothetical protein
MSKKVSRIVQHKAILELFTGKPIAEIAEMYEITPQTLNAWLRSDKGEQMYTDAQKSLYQAGLNVLIEGAESAALQLRGIISNPDTPSAVKARSIEILFKYAQPPLCDTNQMIDYLTREGYVISANATKIIEQLKDAGVDVALIEPGSETNLSQAIETVESDLLGL